MEMEEFDAVALVFEDDSTFSSLAEDEESAADCFTSNLGGVLLFAPPLLPPSLLVQCSDMGETTVPRGEALPDDSCAVVWVEEETPSELLMLLMLAEEFIGRRSVSLGE